MGLSIFTIVGRPDGTIKESRERITAAIANSGFAFPVRRNTCILASARCAGSARVSTYPLPPACWPA